MFPKIHIFLFTEENPFISPIPFSFYPPFIDKPVFDEKVKNCILKVTKPYQLTKKSVKTVKNALVSMVYSNEIPIFAFEKSSKFQRSYDKRTFYR